jgi:hypothetical protein
MPHSVLADGIFDFDEAVVRIATIVVIPVAMIAVGYFFYALSKLGKK